MAVKVLEGCRYNRGTGKNHAAKSHGSGKTFTGLAARPLPADLQRVQDTDHVRRQVARSVLVPGQLMQQGLRHRRAELALELGDRRRAGHDLVVPGHAGRLVLAHAVREQVVLVAEVEVQHAVRELGVRQGTPGQREGPQAGRGLAGPAPL
jgi:hypothetical protein